MGIEQTKGHTADGGGLRGHSVGDIYPYIIMGKGEPVRWFIIKSGDQLDTTRGREDGYDTVHQAMFRARIFKDDDNFAEFMAGDDSLSSSGHGDPRCIEVY